MKNQTVCLTGHRPKGLPWGYDEEKDICKKFKKHLRLIFRKIIKKGFTNFYTGMAEGFDMIATEILISLKRKHKINIWAAVPCKNQEAKWKLSQQERYHNILKECDKIIILSDTYTKTCMQERNRFMVENSNIVIAYFSGKASGTGNTIKLAIKQNLEVINTFDYFCTWKHCFNCGIITLKGGVMEQNKEMVFETQKIYQRDLKLLLEQITQTALMAKTTTIAGKTAMADAIKLYINYTANKRGILCTYTFRDDTKTLSKEEIEELKRSDAGVNFAKAQPQFNNIEFSDVLLSPKTLGDFAFYVSIIEHEFQHMVNNRDQNFYTNENPLGLKMEFSSHQNALAFLQKFVKKNSKIFTFADSALINSTAKCLYYFDDNEKSARLCGMTAEQEFLKYAGKLAKKFGMPLVSSKLISQAVILDEQEKNRKQHYILQETQQEMHKLLYSLHKIALDTKNHTLAEAVAETQDIAQLYNPVIYRNLTNFAINENNPVLALLLDNSKHTKVSMGKIKHDIKKFLEADGTRSRQDAFNMLFNHSQSDLIKLFKKERNLNATSARIVVAQEYALEGPALSAEAQTFVDKINSKTAKKKEEKTDEIIIAKEQTDDINVKLLFKDEKPKHNIQDGIIIAEEQPEEKKRKPRKRKGQKEENSYESLFEMPKNEDGVIEAKELADDNKNLSEMSQAGQQYMQRRKMRAERQNLDSDRNL